MKPMFWLAVALLVVLHHDFWFWHDGRLVWGFLPVGLFYHMVLSVVAAGVWWWGTHVCWPADLPEATPDSRERA